MNRKQRRAFEAGKRAAKTGQLPAGYYDLIERMAGLIRQWIAAEPGLPDLRWHDMTADKTMLIGPLAGDSLKYLAGSPDAMRLCQWLDAQTNGEATLYQATWALKMAGQIPGLETESSTTHRVPESPCGHCGKTESSTTHRVPESPCGHCGKMLGGITGEAGAIPRAGSVTVCAYCGGVSELDAELRPRPLTDEQVGALDPALRRQAYEGQAVIRSAVAGMLRGKRKPPVGEA